MKAVAMFSYDATAESWFVNTPLAPISERLYLPGMNDTKVIVQVAVVSGDTIKFGQAYRLQGGMMTPGSRREALDMIELDLKGGKFPLVSTDQPTPDVIEYGGVRYVPES